MEETIDTQYTVEESSVIFKVIKYVQYCFSECWKHILHQLSKDYYDAAHELIKFLNEYYSIFSQEDINNIEQINNEGLFVTRNQVTLINHNQFKECIINYNTIFNIAI